MKFERGEKRAMDKKVLERPGTLSKRFGTLIRTMGTIRNGDKIAVELGMDIDHSNDPVIAVVLGDQRVSLHVDEARSIAQFIANTPVPSVIAEHMTALADILVRSADECERLVGTQTKGTA